MRLLNLSSKQMIDDCSTEMDIVFSVSVLHRATSQIRGVFASIEDVAVLDKFFPRSGGTSYILNMCCVLLLTPNAPFKQLERWVRSGQLHGLILQ